MKFSVIAFLVVSLCSAVIGSTAIAASSTAEGHAKFHNFVTGKEVSFADPRKMDKETASQLIPQDEVAVPLFNDMMAKRPDTAPLIAALSVLSFYAEAYKKKEILELYLLLLQQGKSPVDAYIESMPSK